MLLDFALSLPIDCIYSTPRTAIYATSNDHIITIKQKLQKTHQFMRKVTDDKQEQQKTYYDRSRYGPIYKIGEEVLVFNPTVKKDKNEKLPPSIEHHTQ